MITDHLFIILMLHLSAGILVLLLILMRTFVLKSARVMTVIGLLVERRIHFIGPVVVDVLVRLNIIKCGVPLRIVMVNCFHLEIQNVRFISQGLNVSFLDCFEILRDPKLVFVIVNNISSIQIFPAIHLLGSLSLNVLILFFSPWIILLNLITFETTFLLRVTRVTLIIVRIRI